MTKYTIMESIHILHSLFRAMGPHSVLFLDERVVTETSSDEHIIPIANMRMAALAMFNDRTSGQGGLKWWKGLLECIGFEILEVKRYSNLDNIIVCKRKNEENGGEEMETKNMVQDAIESHVEKMVKEVKRQVGEEEKREAKRRRR